METFVALISGAIVLSTILHRVQAIDSLLFFWSVRLHVFCFTALGLGLMMIDPFRFIRITNVNWSVYSARPLGYYGPSLIAMATLLTAAIYPILMRALMRRSLSTTFSDMRRYGIQVGLFFFGHAALMLLALAVGMRAAGIFKSGQITPEFTLLKAVGGALGFSASVLYYIPVIGFVHALCGPIISAYGLASMIISVFHSAWPRLEFITMFDVLEFIGVEGVVLKWCLIVGSTLLGLSEFWRRFLGTDDL